MANKIAAGLLLFLFLIVPARAELLKLDLLEKPAPAFTLKLDIFNGEMSVGNVTPSGKQQELQPAKVEAIQKTIAEEISQSIIYEGYVIKNEKKSALLSVSGEPFLVGELDQILDKIKIIKIDKNLVTIEYENQPYDIKIKGDENGEVK